MAIAAGPVLSIFVRRFGHDVRDDIMQSLAALQKVAADQPGYLGDHNSLKEAADGWELVNVFAFDSQKNLQRWEGSEVRKSRLAELDRHPQEATRHSRADDLAQLLRPTSAVSKIEIVVILIFWILALGALLGLLADMVLPATFPAFGRSVLLITINVLLISYIFLPWTSGLLARLKGRLAGATRRN